MRKNADRAVEQNAQYGRFYFAVILMFSLCLLSIATYHLLRDQDWIDPGIETTGIQHWILHKDIAYQLAALYDDTVSMNCTPDMFIGATTKNALGTNVIPEGLSGRLERVLEANLQEDGVMFDIGCLRLLQGREVEAQKSFLDARNTVMSDPLYGIMYGFSLQAAGDHAGSSKEFARVIELYPWFVSYQWFQDLEQHNPDEAKSILNLVLQEVRDRDDFAAADVRGWIDFNGYDYDRALIEFRRTTQLLPSYGRAWLGLALTSKQTGDNVMARKASAKAYFLGISSPRPNLRSDYADRAASLYHEQRLKDMDIIPLSIRQEVYSLPFSAQQSSVARPVR